MMNQNRLCEALGIEKPIIQGPMAWISTAALVSAVSNSGGLGVLGVGFAPPEFIVAQIRETKKLTNKPFAINVVMIPQTAMLDAVTTVAIEEKAPVIYADTILGLELSLCEAYFSKWKAAGIKIVVKASTIGDALTAQKAGADVIIVKGWEGGGHVSFEATTVLVPQAADLLTTPIVASGGIADGRGMAAALALGADGIEMGTIFMCAAETTIHPNAKQAILDAHDMNTVVTGTCTGEPCRQIKNALSEKLLEIEANNTASVAADQIKQVTESSLKRAMMEGDTTTNGAVMAGQIAPLVKEIQPVSVIIDSTLEKCRETIASINKI